MPERTSYDQGVPSWVDLATPDPEAAKAFYSAVFDWDWQENPTDQGGSYFMANKGDKAAAGMMAQPPQMAEQGLPAMWNTYVTVDDVEATTAQAEAAGGAVMMPPMQVMESGNMSVVQDPSGAVVGLWQAKDHIGSEVVNEPGAFCWAECQTADVDAASAFYGELFGWQSEQMDMGEGAPPYTVWKMAGYDEGVAGSMPPAMDGIPPHWSTVFACDDCDARTAKAVEAGGSVIQEPFDMPIGRLAVLADPQGAVFQMLQMAEPGA